MCLNEVDFSQRLGRFLRALIDRAFKRRWPGKWCLLFEISLEDPHPPALVEISGNGRRICGLPRLFLGQGESVAAHETVQPFPCPTDDIAEELCEDQLPPVVAPHRECGRQSRKLTCVGMQRVGGASNPQGHHAILEFNLRALPLIAPLCAGRGLPRLYFDIEVSGDDSLETELPGDQTATASRTRCP